MTYFYHLYQTTSLEMPGLYMRVELQVYQGELTGIYGRSPGVPSASRRRLLLTGCSLPTDAAAQLSETRKFPGTQAKHKHRTKSLRTLMKSGTSEGVKFGRVFILYEKL